MEIIWKFHNFSADDLLQALYLERVLNNMQRCTELKAS